MALSSLTPPPPVLRVVHAIETAAGGPDLPGRARPFSLARRESAIVPFAVVATVAVIAVAALPPSVQPVEFGIGALLTSLAIGVAVAIERLALPAPLDVAPPIIFIAAVALIRDAGGGHEAELVPLFALPFVWVALYGTLGQAAAILVAYLVATTLPIVLIGAPAYPETEWRGAVVNAAIGSLILGTVRGLVMQLEGVARADALTGSANRRSLDERLVAEVRRASRSNRPLSVVMLDLDHFKRYNDRLGHQAGDRLLISAVARWRDGVRPGDVLARYGGEEFVAILPDCPPAAAMAIAGRLRAATPDGQTISAGVATLWPGETAGDLLGRADAALYRAKASGRDRALAA
ncbi:MAG TPA: GGDEF domain-containing protein [Candidatus Limnocylindrales bacterium]